MLVEIRCPKCSAGGSVEEPSLGKNGRCKRCGHSFSLARAGEAPSSGAGSGPSPSANRPFGSPLDLPERFGRYRIVRKLGQGGMGAVYLAHDEELDRPVALKVPFFAPDEGAGAIERFRREARAAATLDHPNLCPVHDVGAIDGVHYLTMPYLEGKTLQAILDARPAFAEAQAVAIVRKLALAVQVAHEKGIIHRDLKPGNVLVTRHRDLVVMDFGLARRDAADDATLTRTGSVLGTALYMAPEQAAGSASSAGPACDVYSLGVILYELLAGVRPFEGPWSLVIGLKTVMDPEPPSKHRPELSPALDAVCRRAIARAPGDRYASMAEFAAALGGCLGAREEAPNATMIETPTGSFGAGGGSLGSAFSGLVTQIEAHAEEPRGRPPRARRMMAAGAVLIVLGLGVAGLIAAFAGRRPGAVARAPASAGPPAPPREPVATAPSGQAGPSRPVADTPVPPPDEGPEVATAERDNEAGASPMPGDPAPTPEPASDPEPGPDTPAKSEAAKEPPAEESSPAAQATPKKGASKKARPRDALQVGTVWQGVFAQGTQGAKALGEGGLILRVTLREGNRFEGDLTTPGGEQHVTGTIDGRGIMNWAEGKNGLKVVGRVRGGAMALTFGGIARDTMKAVRGEATLWLKR